MKSILTLYFVFFISLFICLLIIYGNFEASLLFSLVLSTILFLICFIPYILFRLLKNKTNKGNNNLKAQQDKEKEKNKNLEEKEETETKNSEISKQEQINNENTSITVCPNCHTKNDKKNLFCTNCNEKLK